MAYSNLFKKINGNITPNDDAPIDISSGLYADFTGPKQQLDNKDFNVWSITDYTPDGFEVMLMGSGSVERSTDSHAGTYALQLNIEDDFAGSKISPVLFNSGTPAVGDETLQLTVYAKRLTGVANIGVIYQCANGGDEYTYNFSTTSWEILGGEPGVNNVEILTATTSYTQLTSTQATVPSGYTDGAAVISGISASAGTSIVIDDLEMLVAGTDTAVNGDFEAWTAINTPDSWDISSLKGESYTITEETIIINSGTSAVKMTDSGGNNSMPYAAQAHTGTENDEFEFSYYARGASGNSGTVTTVAFLLNGPLASATKMYNFADEDWADDFSDYESLAENNKKQLVVSTSETYTQDDGESTVPASGTAYLYVYVETDGIEGEIAYIDTASLVAEGSGVSDVMAVGADGVTTFTGVVKAAATDSDGGLITYGQFKEGSITLLDYNELNMKVTGTETLYVNDTGKTVLPMYIVQVCNDSVDYTVAPIWQIGFNDADYNNYINSGSVSSPSSENTFQEDSFSNGSPAYTLDSGENLKIKITTASTATTHIVTFYVYGIILGD